MAATMSTDDIRDKALTVGDGAQAARLLQEAAQQEREALCSALDVVEGAAASVPHRRLPAFARRVARIYGRALARMDSAERTPVRDALKAARQGDRYTPSASPSNRPEAPDSFSVPVRRG